MREKIVRLVSLCGFAVGSVGAALAIHKSEERAKENVDQSTDHKIVKFLKKIGIGAIALGVADFAGNALANSWSGNAEAACLLAERVFKKKK